MTIVFDFSQHTKPTDLKEASKSPLNHLQQGVSVIIALKNAGIPFLQALQAILKQSFLRELILIDRGSPSELLDCLQKISSEIPKLRLVPNREALSKVEAYNLGAKRAYGRYLLFLDQHTILPEKALAKFVMVSAQQGSKLCIIGATVKKAIEQHDPFNNLLNPKQAFWALLGNKKFYNQMPKAQIGFQHNPTIDSSCFFMQRQQFWNSEGFDTLCQGNAKILDLCLKIHVQGGNVIQLEDLIVRSLTDTTEPESEMLHFLGLMHFYKKHYRATKTKYWLFVLIPMLFLRAFWRSSNKKLFGKKKNISKEPSLAELLKKQTLA